MSCRIHCQPNSKWESHNDQLPHATPADAACIFGRKVFDGTPFSVKAAIRRALLAALFTVLVNAARADGIPDAIGRQLPSGYVALEVARGRLTGGQRDDYVVALARPDDDPDAPIGGNTAAARPLLLFLAKSGGGYVLAGRNDEVVMRHDQGGQCDPFDPVRGLVMTGVYITVQNEVACGAHWSDYITFRYDRARGELLFDSEIYHSWKVNPSDAPDAEALVPDGAPTVQRADPHHRIRFSAWKPAE